MKPIFNSLKRSKATSLIMLINLVVFILIVINGGFNSSNMVRFGASNSGLILKGQYYRVFTQLFVHTSYLHFLFNMMVICMIGPSIEDKYGPLVVLFVFLLAGLFDEVFSFSLLENWEAAGGSSTGYFGLYGLAIGSLLFYKDEDLNKRARQFIYPMILVFLTSEIYFRIRGGRPQFFFEYSQSHLIGFFVGVILSGVFQIKGYKLDKRISIIFTGLFTSLLILFFILAYFGRK